MIFISFQHSIEKSKSRGFHDSPNHDFYQYRNNDKKDQQLGIVATAIKNFIRGFSKILLQKPVYYNEYDNYYEDEYQVHQKDENVFVRDIL